MVPPSQARIELAVEVASKAATKDAPCAGRRQWKNVYFIPLQRITQDEW
jgi:hypothetical protein